MIEWQQQNTDPTIRYRFFYAQEDDIGVEVALNHNNHLQVGILSTKYLGYIGKQVDRLMDSTNMLRTQNHFEKPTIFYNEALLTSSLLAAAKHIGESSVEKAIQKNMGTILQNINDFLKPYYVMDEVLLTNPKTFTEAFPEHQLYAMLHSINERGGVMSESLYLVKSDKGLPYFINEKNDFWVFRTTFGTQESIYLYMWHKPHLTACVSFPSILNAKKLYESLPAREKVLRVSFAKINDFNPCLVKEIVKNVSQDPDVYKCSLTITTFPAPAFHRYLQGKIELPEGMKENMVT